MKLRTTYSTKVPVGGANRYKLRPVFTYSHFFGLGGGGVVEGAGYVGGSFYGGICHGGRELQ